MLLLGQILPRLAAAGLAAALLADGGCATSPARAPVRLRGVAYSHLERREPRPLQIHVLAIDLREPGLALAAATAPDPDGSGPAETALTPPLALAASNALVAAVNANAWGMVPPTPAGEKPRYTAGAACDVCGWLMADGVQRSPPQAGYWSFWLDRDRRPHIGNVAAPASNACLAVSGFSGLLREGHILPAPSDVRHPRTALGIDREGRILTLAVVDGRQAGYSEGMSERELAALMLELGCADALNLDGGGSTVMILRDASGELAIVNRPSDSSGPRPIPVLLGVRRAP